MYSMPPTVPAPSGASAPKLDIPRVTPLVVAALDLGLSPDDVRAYATRSPDRLEPLALAARALWLDDRLDAALDASHEAATSARPSDALPAAVVWWRRAL